jgi:hypothetical protein
MGVRYLGYRKERWTMRNAVKAEARMKKVKKLEIKNEYAATPT